MISSVITVIRLFANILVLLVIVKVIISYFLSPYHPFRMRIDQLVDPLLNPIRKIVPTLGSIDISPIVLVLLIQIIESLVINMLYSVR